MSTNNLLEVSNLAKAYKRRTVVKSVSMHIHGGEIIGLLGPNGAGKTTCFYMIVGLIENDSGEIRLNRQLISHLPMHQRARLGIGYLPQEASIFRKMSVRDNVLSILEMRNDLDQDGRAETLQTLLEELGVAHLSDQQGISLSGGERRRVEIARALAAKPRFILLDEPFAGIDPISVIEIQRIVEHLTDRGIGVLITDHNVRETLGICHHAYILNEGTVLAEGKPETILANEEVRNVYLGKEFHL